MVMNCIGHVGRYLTDRPLRNGPTHMGSRGFQSMDRAVRRLATFLAVGLPMFAGLTGCADDSLLTRGASPVDMRPSAPPSAARAVERLSADETGMNPAATAQGRAKKYYVAIGRVVLANHAGDDFWSAPDIFVQVQRRDPEVLELIRRAESRLTELARQRRAADKELKPLKEKQRISELTPGEPLSPTQVARLDELSRNLEDACDASSRRTRRADCSRYDERLVCVECEACNELRFLQEKKTESEIVPGPPLTPEESERLQQLEEEVECIASDQRQEKREKERLWNAITGNTHTITTSGYTLDFGGQAIQEVFPGDEVWIAVYDRDLGEHDLYGSTALRMKDAILGGGEVELAMPNVKSLILRIILENHAIDHASRRRHLQR